MIDEGGYEEVVHNKDENDFDYEYIYDHKIL